MGVGSGNWGFFERVIMVCPYWEECYFAEGDDLDCNGCENDELM